MMGKIQENYYGITNLKIFAGYYGTSGGENVPCLVYSTFSNRVFIYHNIKLPSVASTNLITAMQNKVQPHWQGCSQKIKWRAATLLSDLSFVSCGF